MSLDTAGVSSDSLFPKGAIMLLCKEGQIVLMFISHIYLQCTSVRSGTSSTSLMETLCSVVFNPAATRGPSSCMFDIL